MKRTLLLSLSLLFFTAPVAFGQIELDTDGNVGIGADAGGYTKLTAKCIDNGNCSGSYETVRGGIYARVIDADEVYGIRASVADGYYANRAIWGTATNGNYENYAGYFSGDAKVTGTLYYGSLQQSSDRRFKTSMQDLASAGMLAKLVQLNPIS